MHVLVTRPETEADGLRQALDQRGHTVSLAPLLEARARRLHIDATDIQATIATSRNALRALTGQPALETIRLRPLFAVGPATGALARELGFTHVVEGPAGGKELAGIIAANAQPELGALLYIAGDVVAFDLAPALEARGYQCHKAIVYEMVEATAFPAATRASIAAHALDAVVLMSPRTATVFVRLVLAAGLENSARRLKFLCLSQSVATPLEPLAPPSIAVARMPNSEEILALIDQISSKSA